jgi:hypothetical protein
MGNSLIEVGKVEPRYTTSGRLSSYTVELRHLGLCEHRQIKSSDFNVLQNKTEAILLKWEEKWLARQKKGALQATAESAIEETEAAQAALDECEKLLTQTLEVDDRILWDTLKPTAEFVWSLRDRRICAIGRIQRTDVDPSCFGTRASSRGRFPAFGSMVSPFHSGSSFDEEG